MYIRQLKLLHEKTPKIYKYPFSIPAIKTLNVINFRKNITFFVGENGSGKSTLLEAIAFQCGFHTGGGGRDNIYISDSKVSELGKYIRISWLPKISNGFFFRADSFLNFASYLEQLDREHREIGINIDVYKSYGGKSLHEQSHGESFLSLFLNRFGKKGIYLLDEPEAALSPTHQLSFLRIMHLLEQEGQSQFIIATHSPIILGYPRAQILNFDLSPIKEIKYEDTNHYIITKRFLQDRDSFLKELL